MKKRMLSLICVLALCLGLLPVTALAAEEIKLFIGGQQITESGCYENQNGTWTKVDGTEPANGQFSYDAAAFTLTLNEAEITNNQTVNVAEGYTYYGSVIAFSQTADVSLKIVVSQGTSTITGTGGIRVESTTGDVSLSIAGPGSLEVKNVSNDSGIVLIGSKNVNLGINSADVTISDVQYYGVHLAAGNKCQSTATINDGNLTVSDSVVGIYFMRLYNNDGPSSLTVSGNAMVDTEGSTGGIINGSPDSFQIGADGESGGIVFNGKNGTVYGDVTLQENLEIGNDETLTIGKDASLTVPEEVELTNNGKIDNSGELNGTVDGSGTVTPKITTDSLPDGTVNQLYTATLQATGNGITWSLDSGSTLPNGLKLEKDTISGTPTAADTYTFTVTATNDSGSDSKEYTLNIKSATVPVTGVTLNKTSTSLYVGDTETLTATVAPDNATNKAVTWTSSDSTVATVDQNGVVTALARGTAVITATAADGSGANATCTVTVSRYSSGGGSSSSSTSLSDRAIDDIQDARPGDTVEITLRPGRTTLEREVFEELAGQDITLEIDAGDGVLWTVNGLDIPEDTRLHDLDLDVDLGDSDIPATVLNAVTGEISTVQLSLAHDGEFGFTMTLSAPLGRDNADYWANLYWFNERTEELEFQQAARIARDGTAEFDLDHASDYAIVIDDRSHEPVDLPFNDVPESYWAYDAIQYVYGEGLMAGTSGSTFSPEGTTTRGQIVTILWRLSGSPVVNYLMDFDDVDPAAYYAEAIRWATSEGIAGGYGGGVFGPDDPITREQLAVMLHRYAQHEGYDVSIGEDTNILSYADAFTVSEYAVSALQWACGAGIISGTGDGSTLSPHGQATRAQAAVMLMRFCEEYVTW